MFSPCPLYNLPLMIHATCPKIHRTSIGKGVKKGGNDHRRRLIGCNRGTMNTKLHAICNGQCRASGLFVTAGQVSGHLGVRPLPDSLPDVDRLLGDRGCDANRHGEAFQDKGIKPRTPGPKSREEPVRYDERPYKRRNRIEIVFGRRKDRRRDATI